MLTPAFHFSILESFFNIIIENTDNFMKKLSKEENSEEFDVYSYVNNWTLDVICGEYAQSLTKSEIKNIF